MLRYTSWAKTLLRRPTQTILTSRALKARNEVFRSELPKYKVDPGTLPPLTDLLTHHQTIGEEDTLEGLMSEKLKVYKQYLPEEANFLLLEALFNPKNDIDQLLRIIDENLIRMTSFYMAACFEALDDMMKYFPDTANTVAVSPEFKKLATATLFKMRYLEADELIKLIKCLASLRMQEDTLLVQSTLQMIRHLINEFEPNELEFLDTCLDKLESTDKSDKSLLLAIKRALPKALEMSKTTTRPSIADK